MKSWEYAQNNLNKKINYKESIEEILSPEDLFTEEGKEKNENDFNVTQHENLLKLNEDEDVVDIATPYKI